MTKPFKAAGVIGRFQGPHNAHFRLLRKAAQVADKVVVYPGSAYQPRTFKNPWTVAERIHMLNTQLELISSETGAEFVFEPIIDRLYDYDGWIADVQAGMAKHTIDNDNVVLVGHHKDETTSEYLNKFPQWTPGSVDLYETLDATDIRNMYFSDRYNSNFLTGVMPAEIIDYLEHFRTTAHFQYIMYGKRVVEDRRKMYDALPYPHVAVTADAVVTCNGHILLIQRRAHPGKDLWALPGGYFDAIKDDEPIDAVFRELVEETKIDVPKKVLRGSLADYRTFSSRSRSLLGRSITHAGRIPLAMHGWEFPKVKGADDAKKARWVPFNEIRKSQMFDDHYDIISHYIQLPTETIQ